jgi:hypothetical protein
MLRGAKVASAAILAPMPLLHLKRSCYAVQPLYFNLQEDQHVTFLIEPD